MGKIEPKYWANNRMHTNIDTFLHHNNISNHLNLNDVYMINYMDTIGLCRNEYEHDEYELHSNQISFLKNEIKRIIENYKKVLINANEEFNADYESITEMIDSFLKADIKVFIHSFDCCVNDFLKFKYPNDYGRLIVANSPITLIKNYAGAFDGRHIKRNKKLLFLNYNRKINRDEIICYLNRKNELFNSENFISYHNNHSIESYKYYRFYKNYAIEKSIDFDFLKTLKLQPEEIDIHAQNETQNRAQELHCMSKFNIICEPYFGFSDDSLDFAPYHHAISRKTTYPLLHRNVIFVHEHNNLLSNTLKNLGFQLFFDNIEDFMNNMSDEYYYSKEVQTKMDINEKLIKEYSGMGLHRDTDLPKYREALIHELSDFFIKK
jgi:hypothetical protein